MDFWGTNFINFVFLLFLHYWSYASDCLQIIDLEVPSRVVIGKSYSLHCKYNLEGKSLESVKWYQNDSEFYRHAPGNTAKKYDQYFPMSGANAKSEPNFNGSIIYLKILSEDASGKYKCEVTTEKDFNTAEKEASLLVTTANGVSSWLQSSNKLWPILALTLLSLL